MGILSTPHAHTKFVDGKNTAREMVEAAIEKGFDSIGFSEHGRQTVDEKYGLSAENEKRYYAEIRALREEYLGRIRIWLGIERDYFSVADRRDVQYVIGSVHYLDAPDGHVAVDGDAQRLLSFMQSAFGGDGVALAKAYYERLADYVVSYRPDIVGHFDLICKTNGGGRYFDEDGKAYRAVAFEALESMAGTGCLLEINTGAIARGYKDIPYPREAFLKRWRELGGRVIFSSDSHRRETIDCAFELAKELAVNCGYDTAWALGAGNEMFVEYSLKE
jgi:histidinol-phosphatase (PHP family)